MRRTCRSGRLHDGPITELADGRTSPVILHAGTERRLDVIVALPGSSTNDTMTDVARYAWQAYAGAEQSAVLGASTEARPGQLGTAAGRAACSAASPRWWVPVSELLPATGSAVGLGLLATAGTLVGVGAVLWRRGRRQSVGSPTR